MTDDEIIKHICEPIKQQIKDNKAEGDLMIYFEDEEAMNCWSLYHNGEESWYEFYYCPFCGVKL